jgi:hydrogenase expression/formation protein HypE
MQQAAALAGVSIVTGDTTVVNRGAADKLFITPARIGVSPTGIELGAHRATPGDAIIVSGFIGDHGATILNARGDLALDAPLRSDTRPLHGLVQAMLATGASNIHCLRDATRGGVASVLNEFAQASGVALRIEEQRLPLRDEVRGVCAILGLDPLYFANEGCLVAIVSAERAEVVLAAMRGQPCGTHAAIVGQVAAQPSGLVTLLTRFGGERVVDMLTGEQLPRIC